MSTQWKRPVMLFSLWLNRSMKPLKGKEQIFWWPKKSPFLTPLLELILRLNILTEQHAGSNLLLDRLSSQNRSWWSKEKECLSIRNHGNSETCSSCLKSFSLKRSQPSSSKLLKLVYLNLKGSNHLPQQRLSLRQRWRLLCRSRRATETLTYRVEHRPMMLTTTSKMMITCLNALSNEF